VPAKVPRMVDGDEAAADGGRGRSGRIREGAGGRSEREGAGEGWTGTKRRRRRKFEIWQPFGVRKNSTNDLEKIRGGDGAFIGRE